MKNITKKEAELAIAAWRAIKIKEAEVKGELKEIEAVIEAYSVANLGSFADGRLPMDAGIILLKAGTAKPIREGKPLSTAERAALAAALPAGYVKTACDFGVLFGAQDKTVRQILAARGIEIVRDDKFTVL